MQMRAARMHGYNQPLQIDDVRVPELGPTQVLIKVAATGMCRSDFQLVDGYFRQGLPVDLPFTPGHEVAGTIAAVGKEVPTSSGLSEGDPIVVDPNWGDGTCRQCHEGNEQLCRGGQLVGFGPNGGFAEYMVAPHNHVISVTDLPKTARVSSAADGCGADSLPRDEEAPRCGKARFWPHGGDQRHRWARWLRRAVRPVARRRRYRRRIRPQRRQIGRRTRERCTSHRQRPARRPRTCRTNSKT